MDVINIRESLLDIDRKTYCKYDLTTLYEACNLDDQNKKKLVQYIASYEHPSVIGKFLETNAGPMMEAVADDLTDAETTKVIDDINDGTERTLWNLLDKADEEDKKLSEDVNWRTAPSNSREVSSYVYRKIKMHDDLTSDDSRYWDFDRCVREGDDAKLVKSAPKGAKYSFSLVNGDVDIDLYMGYGASEDGSDCWFVVDNNPDSDVQLEMCEEAEPSYKDRSGILGIPGERYTMSQLDDIWEQGKDSDPSMMEYKGNRNAWFNDTLRHMDESVTINGEKLSYAVINPDGTYAGVPCATEEEARELAAQKEGRVVVKLGEQPLDEEGCWENGINEDVIPYDKDVEFNDKYFPRVNIADKTRYEYVQHKGKDFAYDRKHSLLIYLFKDDEEVEKFGDRAPWRELDASGLRAENWDDLEARQEYLDEYCFNLDAESSYLAQDFIQNELPMYQNNDDSVEEGFIGDLAKVGKAAVKEVGKKVAKTDFYQKGIKPGVDAWKEIGKEVKGRVASSDVVKAAKDAYDKTGTKRKVDSAKKVRDIKKQIANATTYEEMRDILAQIKLADSNRMQSQHTTAGKKPEFAGQYESAYLKKLVMKRCKEMGIQVPKSISEAVEPTVLTCRVEIYERYGSGGIRKIRVKARDEHSALVSLLDKIRTYVHSDSAEEMSVDEILQTLEESNGDGCDYIMELKNETTGEVLLAGDGELDWEEYGDEEVSTEETTAKKDVGTSGTTGDCTWTLDGTHLTITGNGAMGDYGISSAPWGTSITSVSIGSGVTAIGYKAFYNCRSLTAVTIGDSVTTIWDCAFYNCTALTSVTIPDSVTTIGDLAFYGCDSLTSVTLPSSVTSIGKYSFYECSNLDDKIKDRIAEIQNKNESLRGDDYVAEAVATAERPMSKMAGTLSSVLLAHKDEVETLFDVRSAIEFLDRIRPEVKNVGYVDKVKSDLMRKRGANPIQYFWNIILKGDGEGTDKGGASSTPRSKIKKWARESLEEEVNSNDDVTLEYWDLENYSGCFELNIGWDEFVESVQDDVLTDMISDEEFEAHSPDGVTADQEWLDDYIRSNAEEIFRKYEKKLLDQFRDIAQERANDEMADNPFDDDPRWEPEYWEESWNWKNESFKVGDRVKQAHVAEYNVGTVKRINNDNGTQYEVEWDYSEGPKSEILDGQDIAPYSEEDEKKGLYEEVEIDRKNFASLVKDREGYFVLVDGTYQRRIIADTDEEAMQKFRSSLEESADGHEDETPYTHTQVFDELKLETRNFTIDGDTIQYYHQSEANAAVKILKKHYTTVEGPTETTDEWFRIEFSGKKGSKKTESAEGEVVHLDLSADDEMVDIDIDNKMDEALQEEWNKEWDNIGVEIEKAARAQNIAVDFISTDRSVMGSFTATFEINRGDWKHDHWAFDEVVKEYLANHEKYALWKIDTKQIGSSLDDTYSAEHIAFIVPKDKMELLNSMRGLFAESVNPAELTDCPECGDTSFDPKRSRCTKCSYREGLNESKSIKESPEQDSYIESEVKRITKDFTEPVGGITFDAKEDADVAETILSAHYQRVVNKYHEKEGNYFVTFDDGTVTLPPEAREGQPTPFIQKITYPDGRVKEIPRTYEWALYTMKEAESGNIDSVTNFQKVNGTDYSFDRGLRGEVIHYEIFLADDNRESSMLEEGFDDDFSDEELANIYGGDTNNDIPDGLETPEETEARLNESSVPMIYLFPELSEDDKVGLLHYNLRYLGKNHGPDGSENNSVVLGTESDLRAYAEKDLGYELHPDYLYYEDDFAGDIVKEELQ